MIDWTRTVKANIGFYMIDKNGRTDVVAVSYNSTSERQIKIIKCILLIV